MLLVVVLPVVVVVVHQQLLLVVVPRPPLLPVKAGMKVVMIQNIEEGMGVGVVCWWCRARRSA